VLKLSSHHQGWASILDAADWRITVVHQAGCMYYNADLTRIQDIWQNKCYWDAVKLSPKKMSWHAKNIYQIVFLSLMLTVHGTVALSGLQMSLWHDFFFISVTEHEFFNNKNFLSFYVTMPYKYAQEILFRNEKKSSCSLHGFYCNVYRLDKKCPNR
jgi:hypothetical protein